MPFTCPKCGNNQVKAFIPIAEWFATSAYNISCFEADRRLATELRLTPTKLFLLCHVKKG
jgi:hypothetical protein